jgi:iron complex transport system substrate-binding protein
MRVVSLLPGATEMVAALGRLDALVGVTHECDHPPQVASLERVTRRGTGAAGTPLFEMFEDRIRALRPDLIVTQALCEVCAVIEGDVRTLAARLDPVPRIVTCAGTDLDGVFDDLRRVAEALGAGDECDEIVAGATVRMRRVHETLKAAGAPRPRAAVIEWGEPVYAAGHWMPGMVRRAGGVDVLAAPGAHSVPVGVERVRAADPDILIFAPCGYDLPRAAAEGERILAAAEWAWARDRRVFAIDANAFTSRPGPRLVDGIEILARLFNPSLFSPVDPRAARALTLS